MHGTATQALPTVNMKKNAMLLIGVSIICLFFLEGVVRVAGSTDQNGQFIFGIPIQPYALPTKTTEEQIQTYLSHENPYITYDPWLGWTISPNTKSDNGLYESNSIGIRSPHEFNIRKSSNTFRIALFGDSFIHGDDVLYEDSISGQLEQELKQAKTKVEVMNFGVPGYGIDQAFLRWQTEGVQYKPNMVLVGFQPENCLRNTNIHRSFYTKGASQIPFTKPRFMNRKDAIELVNSPTIEPEEIPGLIEEFPETILSEFESFFSKDDYKKTILNKSKLIGIAKTAVQKITQDNHFSDRYEYDSETMSLCRDMLNIFSNDILENGSSYALIHIPQEWMLETLIDNKPLPYEQTREQLAKEHPYIETISVLRTMSVEKGLENIYIPHFSAEANSVVAKTISRYLDENGILNIYEE